MGTRTITAIFCLPLLLSAAHESARAGVPDVAMVVNPVSAVDGLTLGEARRLLLSDQPTWPSKVPVVLFLGEPNTHARTVVLKELYRMSEPEFNQYWIVRMFRGETASGPKTVSSNAVAAQLVKQLPGAVTFIDAAEVPSGMKVIRIDGKLPGEPGYPLR